MYADDPEVVEFAGLSNDMMIESLCTNCSKAQVDQYHDALTRATVKRRGKAWKVGKIVQSLDTDGDGFVDTMEVKILFSRLFGVPADDIPDEDEEVQRHPPPSLPPTSSARLPGQPPRSRP